MAGLVGLPYSIKFLWAPLVDRFKPLGHGAPTQLAAGHAGRARGSIVFLGLQDPSSNIWGVLAAAVCVTFFSATQDIVVDAYRRETLADDEQASPRRSTPMATAWACCWRRPAA